MANIANLLTEHMAIWTAADTEKKSGRGRVSGNACNAYGVKKLRELILELALRGKLVPQDPNDEPASELLIRIQAEKAKLVAEGKLKKEKLLTLINEDERPFELPTGWEWVRLGQTGRIFNGNSINENEKLDKYTNRKSGYPFIATKDVAYGREELNYENGVLIPKEDCSLKVAKKGAVLICAEGGSAGKKVGITNQDICFGNKLFANQLWVGIEPFYIFHLYQSATFYSLFQQKMTGIIGGISLNEFLSIPVPIPSLEEQHRIVAKIDELMALCDQLEQQHNNAQEAHESLVSQLLATLTQSQNAEEFNTNWQRIYAHFDVLFATETSIDALKQTLLQLAVMGKLVPQDPNDEPASELLKRIQAEISNSFSTITCGEKPFDLPHGWNWSSLQSLLSPQRDISYGVIKLGVEPKSMGIPVLRCSDVKPGFISLDTVRKVSEEIEKDYIRTRLQGGEILLNIRGTLGGVALVTEDLIGFNVAREVAVVPISNCLNGKYITFVMLSNYFWQAILEELRGIAYLGLNLRDLRQFSMPVPPLNEQNRIVAKVDELMALCDQLKTRIQQANQQQQAIADALVAQSLKPATAEIIDLAAYRAAVTCNIIKRMQHNQAFGRTFAMKLLYLSQQHIGFKINLEFEREAAGPFNKWIYDFERDGVAAEWFELVEKPLSSGYTKIEYKVKSAIDEPLALINSLGSREQRNELERLFKLFADKKTEETEIAATLFAVWNDFLLNEVSPTDEQIIQEVRENWHSSKARFSPEQLSKWLSWLREKNIVPNGKGTKTIYQTQLIHS